MVRAWAKNRVGVKLGLELGQGYIGIKVLDMNLDWSSFMVRVRVSVSVRTRLSVRLSVRVRLAYPIASTERKPLNCSMARTGKEY
jgi:hypothetical protein